MATNMPVNMDTLITVKVQIQGSNRKFKLPLRDLLPSEFQQKLRVLLAIPNGQDVTFERFSDSAAAYVKLDPENVQVYKTLMRAAKAKLKLRIRATITSETVDEQPAKVPSPPVAPAEPEAPKARPVSLALPFGPLPPHRSAYPIPNRQSLYDLKSSTLDGIKSLSKQASAKLADIDGDDEAPLPRPFPARENFFAELATISRERDLALRMKEPPSASSMCSWSVFCNNCDNPMANEHYHCSICDDGDYDLCSSCVDTGVHCPGEGHWLLKRFVQNGKVINSTTERIAPKPKSEAEAQPVPKQSLEIEADIPGAFTEEKKVEPEVEEPTRTCNSCVKVFPEKDFITCTDCEDYDLCMPCHIGAKHGHHPGHTFQAVTKDTGLGRLAEVLCAPGRNNRHNAICDGCDKFIYGIRHKCLNCPDWDYCSKCIKSAKFIHPVHRFVPIYEPLPEPRPTSVRHYGIYCDGPLCKDKENQTYIEGVRFKCAVCHDTDFCAACEAIPINRHNRTHPLIKFKTPVRNVSVTTMGEDKNGIAMATMGDQFQRKSVSTETLRVSSANAATQVQTIADLKPTEASVSRPAKQLNIKDLLSEPIKEKIKVQDLLAEPVSKPASIEAPKSISSTDLQAHFLRDTITDGTKIPNGCIFTQTWTLHNPGPYAWPAGCSVRYVGGDNMLNVDDSRPSSATEINDATESNVIGRKVEVGEEISFSVMLKAPKREGVAISYWRLKAADGMPFGHRLWCHINVVASSLPYEISAQFPSLQVNPQPVAAEYLADSPHAAQPDYQRQLMLLEMQNKARLDIARESEATRNRQAETKKALADAEKRHAEIRAQALENMRRTAAMIDGDLKKLTSDVANLGLGANAAVSTQKEVEQEAKPVSQTASPLSEPPAIKRESFKIPTPVTVESGPPSPVHNSAMIFPKLEKESPVSSTHEAAHIPATPRSVAATTKTETETIMSPSVKSEELEIFEDAESVEFFEESDSDEDGFVTDEEYDILDASDEETV